MDASPLVPPASKKKPRRSPTAPYSKPSTSRSRITRPTEEGQSPIVERTTSTQSLESIEETPYFYIDEEEEMVGPAGSSTATTTPVPFTAEQQAQIAQIVALALQQQAAAIPAATTIAAATTANGSKDLGLGKVQPFSGKPNTLERFLQDCQLYFYAKPDVFTTAERRVTFLLSHMTGDAARWKEQYLVSRADISILDEADTNAEQFLAKLRASFAEPHRKENALRTLQHLRQGKESVDNHNVNFRLLVEKAGLNLTHNNDILINMYMNSLQPRIKERIITMDQVPTTIEEWYQRAAYFANAFDRLKEGNWFNGNQGKKFQKRRPGYYQSSTQERDPNAMDVDAMTLEERKKRLRDGACFICAEPGHFSNVCPKRKNSRQQPQRQGQGQRQGNGQKRQEDRKGKNRMTKTDFRTHIRNMVIDNFDTPDELEEFMDLVEEEGF